MASNKELEALRAEVARRRKAATEKVGRLRRSTGVDITGTRHDPRRDSANVRRYNARQLTSYLNQLNSFTDRRNTYAKGANGSLISNQRFREYKALEARFNAVGASHEKSLRNLKIPTVNATVEQYKANYLPSRLRAQGDVVQRPYSIRNVQIQNVAGPEALEKLIDSMKNRLNKRYLPEQLAKGRSNLETMLKIMGDLQVEMPNGETMSGIEVARNLSDNQFDILWNYTNVAGIVSIYASERANRNEDVERNSSGDAADLLAWASTLPRTRSAR